MNVGRSLPLLFVLVMAGFNAGADVPEPRHLTASVRGVDTPARAQALQKEIYKLTGVKEARLKFVSTAKSSLSVIYEASVLSAESIQSALVKNGVVLKDVHVDLQSHCESDCPHPCCSYPDKETGKCLCAAKGKDCTMTCCRADAVNK